MDYCDIEWFALETNRDHSVIFDIASKYCISDKKIWINLNYILLSEKNQSKKAIYSMISIICHSGKDKTTEIIKISVVAMGSESGSRVE